MICALPRYDATVNLGKSVRALILAALVLAGCDSEDGLKQSSNVAPAKVDRRLILECDGTMNSTVTISEGQVGDGPRKATQTYRIDERKRDVELWNAKTGSYSRMCRMNNCLRASASSFGVIEDLSGEDEGGMTILRIDRDTGKAESNILRISDGESSGRVAIQDIFTGVCHRVESAKLATTKF